MPEASLTLPADLSSVGRARNFLRQALSDGAVEGFELAPLGILIQIRYFLFNIPF